MSGPISKPVPVEEDTSTVTTVSERSDDGMDISNSCKPDDDAQYLKKELYGRVQDEPELFEWMQTAALDGMWVSNVL